MYINSLYLVTTSPKGITFLLQVIIDKKKVEYEGIEAGMYHKVNKCFDGELSSC